MFLVLSFIQQQRPVLCLLFYGFFVAGMNRVGTFCFFTLFSYSVTVYARLTHKNMPYHLRALPFLPEGHLPRWTFRRYSATSTLSAFAYSGLRMNAACVPRSSADC